MSRYGKFLYGTDYYGEAVDNQYDSTPFSAVAVSYTEAFISWRTPGGSWNELRLVRNSIGIPQDINDGTVILDEPYGVAVGQDIPGPVEGQGGLPGSVSQTITLQWNAANPNLGRNSTSFYDNGDYGGGLTSGRIYYYTLFVFDDNLGIWRPTGSAQVQIPKTYGYTRRLYDRLPEVFKHSDLNTLNELVDDETLTFLFRFLDVFGQQFDTIRTDVESLRHLLDARTVSSNLLPALADHIGIKYEPQIGSRAARRLVQNAVHLYGLKGTLQGIRELASIVTSWGAYAYIGYNLALDDLDAGPKGSQGRWTADLATVGYRANRGDLDGPVGDGLFDLTVTGSTQTVEMTTNQGGVDGFLRRQYAIPIVQGRTYTTSAYVRSTIGGGVLVAWMRIAWLDSKGLQIGDVVDGSHQGTDAADWASRASLTSTAPVGARYLEARIVFNNPSGMTGGQKLYACGFMVDESSTLRPWQCAREILISLQAEHINEAIHPVPDPARVGQNAHWTTGFGPATISTTASGDVAFLVTTTDTTGGFSVFPGDITYPGDEFITVNGATETLQITAQVQADHPSHAAYFIILTQDINGNIVDVTYGGSTSREVSHTDWTTLEFAYTPPDGAVTVHIGIGFQPRLDGSFALFANAEKLFWRNYGVFRSPNHVDYFDGSVRTPTQDDLWEGTQYASRSHHYSQRTARAFRLRELLKDYLPLGTCYALQFSQPPGVYYGSPAALEGFDVNPGTPPPPPPTGRQMTFLWKEDIDGTKSLSLQWKVGSLNAGKNVGLQWRYKQVVGKSLNVLFTDRSGTSVGKSLNVVWNDLQTNAFIAANFYNGLPTGWVYAAQSGNPQTQPIIGQQVLNSGLQIPQANWPVSPTTRTLTDKVYRQNNATGVVSLFATGTVHPYTSTASDGYSTLGDGTDLGVGYGYHHREVYDDLNNLIWRDYGGSAPAQRVELWNVMSKPGRNLGLVWNVGAHQYVGGYQGGY